MLTEITLPCATRVPISESGAARCRSGQIYIDATRSPAQSGAAVIRRPAGRAARPPHLGTLHVMYRDGRAVHADGALLVWIHGQTRMWAGAPQRLGRASPRGAGAAAAEERPDERTDRRSRSRTAGSSQWSGGRAPAGVVGREPAPGRAHGCRDRRPAPQRGFRSAKASERGGAAGCWGSSLRASLPCSPPLAAPPPVVPCSSPRRFREARWTEGRERGSSELPSYARPQVAIRRAAVKVGPALLREAAQWASPTGRASRTPENAEAHAVLDAAVAAAYGWPADVTDDDALRELLKLNGGG